ncbi:hypothetical protein HU200_048881 [Digitaria exilis]|uniref:Uncharacterized protein n=1 Tax=Digitaria exilis TaxID=1010633 RepID=A0A835AUT4_9POAL|nr:hypothetical protein HU200_048881 [Digitaria exilis]
MVIKLGIPSTKTRAKAMALAAKVHGVSSVAITGGDKDQLEVVGVGVDAACLVNILRKKVFRSASILLMEEVKEKKEEKKPLELGWPVYYYYYPQHHHPRPMVVCEEPETAGCHIM